MINSNKLKDEYLIIIPLTSFVSWNWAADYIRQTVLTLSKIGFHVIVYMDSEGDFVLKKSDKKLPIIKNVDFITPKYLIPFNRLGGIREINRKIDFTNLIDQAGNNKKILFWTFGPVSSSIFGVAKTRKNVVTLYDCVDYYGSTNPTIDTFKRATENELIKNVDYFFVNSHALQNLHKSVRWGHLMVQGFAEEVYRKKILKRVSLPHDKPIIGFVGSIDLRIDFKILYSVINKFPNFNFVLWGPVHDEELRNNPAKHDLFKKILSLPNVISGKSSRIKIPSLVKQFDIGIIPYDLTVNFCKYCYPMKLFEYFYLGKPIITTPIEELKRFSNLVKIAKTENDWINNIKSVLKVPISKEKINKQKHLAIDNSWERKVGQILNVLSILKN